MPRKKKTTKIDLRAKIIGQLLDVTGSSIDSWNPAIISDDMKLISYIRNISDTWNPSQLNEALKLLGFRTVDTWNPAQLEETKNNLAQYFLPKIATGNPIELNLAGNLPYTVESAKVTMLPIQSGSGDPSPTNIRPISGRDSVDLTRTGKNLANFVNGKGIDNDGSIINATGRIATVNPILIQSGSSYIFKQFASTESRGILAVFNGSTLVRRAVNIYPNTTLDTSGGDRFYFCVYSNVTVESAKAMIILSTSTATAYEPYQGETHTATFPSTVYGGEYEFVSGKAKSEWGYIASYNGETITEPWISDRDVYVAGTTPSTGAEVCYKLATPTEITLTPQSISLNKGDNVISSNADNIELNYKINFN